MAFAAFVTLLCYKNDFAVQGKQELFPSLIGKNTEWVKRRAGGRSREAL
jgi:hypothetical protein